MAGSEERRLINAKLCANCIDALRLEASWNRSVKASTAFDHVNSCYLAVILLLSCSMLEVLIDNGADVNFQNEAGKTA